MSEHRYLLGFRFEWIDLMNAARDRARTQGRRQMVKRDGSTWLVLPAEARNDEGDPA